MDFVKAAIVGAALVGSVSGAAAADLGAMPVRPGPAPFSWDGFYIGINAGYGFARATSTQSLAGNRFLVGTSTSAGDLNGAVAGGQVGFNWQIDPRLVLGVEFDGQWSSQSSKTVSGCGSGCTTTDTAKIKWLATGRGRIGVVLDGGVLAYGTAGAAWLGASEGLSASSGGISADLLTISASKVGFAAGGGFEVPVGPNWSVKAEYLYVSIESLKGSAAVPAFLGGGTITETARIHENIFRVGANYRFGR